jgi:large subunit ribosomal protein L25
MKKIIFTAGIREGKGKGVARKLRAKGYIPGILYGTDIEPVLIKLNKKLNEKILKHITTHNIIAEIKLKKNGEEETFSAVLKDIQREPIKDEIIHVDFYKLSMDKPVIMDVPILLKGKSKGEEKGGILEQELREIKVEGYLKDIPEVIEVDIENLDFGHAILVKDIKLSSSIKILEEPEKVVATVLRPKEEKVEEEKVEELAEEPKVITQEKVEERRKEKEEKQQLEK